MTKTELDLYIELQDMFAKSLGLIQIGDRVKDGDFGYENNA